MSNEISNQSDVNEDEHFHAVLIPTIENDVPIPKNAKEALPEMTINEELNIRAETIKAVADIKGEDIKPTYSNIKDAQDLAKEMMSNPLLKPEFDKYPNETMAFLAGLVGQTQCMLTEQLADFKLYVLNRLVEVVEKTDNAKEKIAALRSIGEIDGVDAFKKKTEVTHKVESMEEVEKELLSMLAELKAKGLVKEKEVIDAEVVEDER
jgi:hypothetical protein